VIKSKISPRAKNYESHLQKHKNHRSVTWLIWKIIEKDFCHFPTCGYWRTCY